MSDTTVDYTVEDETEATVADDLRLQVVLKQGPDHGTVVIFDYVYDMTEKKKNRTIYTFVSIWIEKANVWYTSGNAGNLVPSTQSHEAFMTTLAKPNVVEARVVIATETFKP